MFSNDFQKKVLFWFGLLGTVQAAAGLFLLGGIPSESKNVILLGLSLERLILLGGMGLILFMFLALSWGAGRNTNWFKRMSQALIEPLQKPKIWGFVVLSSIILLINGSFFTLITPEITELFAQAYFVRLQPFALFGAGIAAQTLLALPLLRYGTAWKQNVWGNRELLRILRVYGVFLIVWGLLEVRLMTLQPDVIGWNSLGTPLLDTQVLAVFIFGVILIGAGNLWGKSDVLIRPGNQKKSQVDWVIGIVLWGLAAFYWHSIPLGTNWYMDAPRPPHFEYYPNADALVYDSTAQSLMAGVGFKSWDQPYPRRPMYAWFLSLLYLVVGQDYERVVSLQSILFAVFPVLIYVITKTLHNRLAGIIAALLVMLREGNALALIGTITVSYTKMAMTDFPAALGVVLFSWIALCWLTESHRPLLPLIAGGVMGALMQIRIETGILLPVVFGIALFQWSRLRSRWFVHFAACFLGILLVLSPWVWRNWNLTGEIFLEIPDHRIQFFIDRLQKGTSEETDPPPPTPEGNSPDENFRQKTTFVPQEASSKQSGRSNLWAIITSHWTHSQVQTLLLFPGTYRIFDSTIGFLGHKNSETFWSQCCSARDYVKRLPYWQWAQWNGQIPLQAIVPILLNLFLVSTGVYLTWKKHKWNGIFPIFFNFVYFFINGVARTSGGRYIFPVDWVWIVYYGIGMAQVIVWIIGLFGNLRPSFLLEETGSENGVQSTEPRKFSWKSFIVVGTAFFMLGAALPISEYLYPTRYTQTSMAQWMAELAQADEGQAITLQQFVENGGDILMGRALYPSFYLPEEGEPGVPFPHLEPRPYPRFTAYLVGPTNIGITLPLQDKPEVKAKSGDDMLVFGCKIVTDKDVYLEAWTIYYSSTGEILVRTPFPETLACPSATGP